MRKFFKLLFIAVIAISCTTSQKDTADIIYKNGRIYTVNESQPWAEALAIKDGRFIAIGDNDDVLAFQGDNTEIVELGCICHARCARKPHSCVQRRANH